MVKTRLQGNESSTGDAVKTTSHSDGTRAAARQAAAHLRTIDELNREHELRYKNILRVDPALTRPLVSFQGNKHRAVYRWFKYKEAFSAGLIDRLMDQFHVTQGALLDPFAGSGTALFVARDRGMRAEGIELLPVGQRIIETKQLIDQELQELDIQRISSWAKTRLWSKPGPTQPITELRITKGAYPPETRHALERYLHAAKKENILVRALLEFALLSILEEVSYTRKDGQYLRWDYRSGRRQGKKRFDKGIIPRFDQAIVRKLSQIRDDLQARDFPQNLFAEAPSGGRIVLHRGSCLEWLPTFSGESFDCIVTSPPYCNRYDYTRTYALELALLGVDELHLRKLRQEMVSCTVENRAKNLLAMNPHWNAPIAAADSQPLLQAILTCLEVQKEMELLNNTGIPKMVRGYFYEMACVIAECARVLKPGAPLLMVNDNVRYAGAGISVDIILSEFARSLGFQVESILVLPNGKGNSSQQMGAHGRIPLRKCVCVWRNQ